MKKLTIAISTYNRVAKLKNTLAYHLSGLAKFEHLEIDFLIVDNCSTDTTWTYLNSVNFNDQKIKIYRNDFNVGMLGNLAIVSSLARSEFIWILGDDDYINFEYLDQIYNSLTKDVTYLNYSSTIDLGLERPIESSSFTKYRTQDPRVGKTGVYELSQVATANNNLFTSIYSLITKTSVAIEIFSNVPSSKYFSNLNSCVPTVNYLLTLPSTTEVFWHAEECVLVDLNVSWMEFAPWWILERIPEIAVSWIERGADKSQMSEFIQSYIPSFAHFADVAINEKLEINSTYLKLALKEIPEDIDIQSTVMRLENNAK